LGTNRITQVLRGTVLQRRQSRLVEALVVARKLHGAAKTKARVPAGHAYRSLMQHQWRARAVFGTRVSDRIALARLHRDMQSELRRDPRRPGAQCQHDAVGTEVPTLGAYFADGALRGGETLHAGILFDDAARLAHPARQLGYIAVRPDARITG